MPDGTRCVAVVDNSEVSMEAVGLLAACGPACVLTVPDISTYDVVDVEDVPAYVTNKRREGVKVSHCSAYPAATRDHAKLLCARLSMEDATPAVAPVPRWRRCTRFVYPRI